MCPSAGGCSEETDVMAYIVGLTLPLLVGLFLTLAGFDRDRAVYPTIMIVIAALYCLFAVIGGSIHALMIETAIFLGFSAVAVLGFKTSLWWVAAALAGHGLMDLVHGDIVANPGVPPWWPAFCGSYDVIAAIYLGALILIRGRKGEPAID
jgi:hypothetical protein